MKIAIIDYDAGNINSVINAFKRLNVDVTLTNDKNKILSADRVILPGVGHAAKAMQELSNRNLCEVIKEIQVPLLGICLGMQLLMTNSEEGNTDCLDIIPGKIMRIIPLQENIKVPHIGWNKVHSTNKSKLMASMPQEYFYFSNSYYLQVNHYCIGTTFYGESFVSMINKDNFFGVQFHPEKSGKAGEYLLENFLRL